MIPFRSGDTGNNLIEWIRFLLGRHLEIPHVKFIYPTAPVQKYTPLNGEYSNVWFDRKSINIEAQENRKSLAAIYETIQELLKREIDGCGIPAKRVIVGGFSMGGALALHTCFHLNQELGGVFALSAFLNNNSVVYESLESRTANDLPKLRAFHGGRWINQPRNCVRTNLLIPFQPRRDSLVLPEWGRKTFDELTRRGVKGDYTELKNTLHELKKNEMIELEKWIQEVVPPLESDLQNKL